MKVVGPFEFIYEGFLVCLEIYLYLQSKIFFYEDDNF